MGLYVHAIGVHGLASVEVEVLEVGEELLLDELLSTLLELLNLLGGLALLLELGLDSLEVACETHVRTRVHTSESCRFARFTYP